MVVQLVDLVRSRWRMVFSTGLCVCARAQVCVCVCVCVCVSAHVQGPHGSCASWVGP